MRISPRCRLPDCELVPSEVFRAATTGATTFSFEPTAGRSGTTTGFAGSFCCLDAADSGSGAAAPT